MLGHVFTTSGATTLACAPGPRYDEYVVLARFDDQYAVGVLDAATMVEPGGPTYWGRGDYFGGLREACELFARTTGLSDVDLLVQQVGYAEDQIARAARAAARTETSQ